MLNNISTNEIMKGCQTERILKRNFTQINIHEQKQKRGRKICVHKIECTRINTTNYNKFLFDIP